jgi:1-acyl-sn-glycerol-3-phosphate acyltransferase
VIRLLWVAIVAVPATIWHGTRILWAARRGGERRRCVCEEVARTWSRILLRAAGVRVELEGAEVIDPDRSQVLVANHVSWFDVLALSAFLPGSYRFVAKQELGRIPFFGPAWQACGHISIDRSDRNAAIRSLAVARRQLEQDHPTIILFPEGTRSVDGRLQRFKRGAFVLAIQTGVDVVPAAIMGSRDVMRKGSFRIRSGTVRIRFGTPIEVEGLEMEDRGLLTDRARSAVGALLEASPEEAADNDTTIPKTEST